MTGRPTYITLGTPIVVGAPAVGDPVDPCAMTLPFSFARTFDDQDTDYGNGPAGDELPTWEDLVDLRWPSDDSLAPFTARPTYFTFENAGFGDIAWVMSSANPRNGTLHGRYTFVQADSGDPVYINPVHCFPRAAFPPIPYFPVSAGDTLDLSFWADDNTATTAGTWTARLVWYNSDFSSNLGQANTDLSTDLTGYTQISLSSQVAPANAAWVLLQVGVFGLFNQASDGDTFDIDDITVDIS